MNHEIKVTLDMTDRMTIEWETVWHEKTSQLLLHAGVCHINQYPEVRNIDDDEVVVHTDTQGKAQQIEELQIIFTQLIKQHFKHVEKLRDISGAALVHNLLLANNKHSVSLAMKLFKLEPLLLLCIHQNGRKEGSQDMIRVFDGEGSLHILAVNKLEDEFKALVELAYKELSTEENKFEKLLMQKAHGSFFKDNAMHLGSTPLAYAAAFGLEKVFERLFVTTDTAKALLTPSQQMLVLNGAKEWEANKLNGDKEPALFGEPHYGHYPIHAVVDSDNTKMYDLLVDQCGALSMQVEKGCPLTGPEQLTPLQLAAKLGRRKMFRHILRKRTKPVWEWGPLAEFEIPVDEIDSANSKGRLTVMEILVAPGASVPSQEMLLDRFMNGFLYKQYREKWDVKGIKNIFLWRLVVISFYVICVSLVAAPSIVPVSVPLFKLSSDHHEETGFLGEQPLLAVATMFLTCFLLYQELTEIVFSILPDEDELVKRKKTWRLVVKQMSNGIVERGGRLMLISTLASFVACVGLLSTDPSLARERGWVRVALALAGSSAWVMLLTQVSFLVDSLRVFVNVVGSALRTDVMQFGFVFVPLLFGFSTGINSLMQLHPVWSTRWASWWLTLENLLLLSFIQEPPVVAGEELPSPSSVVKLLGDFEFYGSDSVLPTLVFYIFFVLYLVVSVVLLINLLIAMMSARYEEQKENAELNTRVAFCRLVLRFERLLEKSTRFGRVLTCRKGKAGSATTQLGSSSKTTDSQRSSTKRMRRSAGRDEPEVAGESQSNEKEGAEPYTHTRAAQGDVSETPSELVRRESTRRVWNRVSRASQGFRTKETKPNVKKEDQRFIHFTQGKSSTNLMDATSGMNNIFDEEDETSVEEQLGSISATLEKLMQEKKDAHTGEDKLMDEKKGIWQKIAAEAAHHASEGIGRARTAHLEQTKAFRTVVEQLLMKGAELGMDSVKQQLRSVDAAFEKTESAMLVADVGIREAANAAGRYAHVADGDTPEPVKLAIDKLRVLTQRLGVGEVAFNAHVNRTLRARAAKSAKRGFVSFIDWPSQHKPFISHDTYPGAPRAEHMRHCLPASELRSFLGDLFGTDAEPNADMEKLPHELMSMLAQALDQNGDGFINATSMYERWSLFFGSKRSLQHKDPTPVRAQANRAPPTGRVHSQSLPTLVQPAINRSGSIMSGHV